MPSRNVIKTYVPDSYYHVYLRGVNKGTIFVDDIDRRKFLSLAKTYLSTPDLGDAEESEKYQRSNFASEIDLISYCLLGNHFHFLIHQKNITGMARFMRCLLISYSMYFNRRQHRSGPVFENRYKASLVSDENYFLHVSRYIHMNPDDYKNYKWSSLSIYQGMENASWVKPQRIMNEFLDIQEYMTYLKEYEDRRQELKDQVEERL